MLEEQGQNLLKDLLIKLLSKIGEAIKQSIIGTKTKITDSIKKIFDNIFNTGEIGEKKLLKMDKDIIPLGDPIDKDAAVAVANQLSKYKVPYSIRIISDDKVQFIGHSKISGLFTLASQDALRNQTSPKKSIKDTLYAKVKNKVQAKQNSKEHSRQQPLKHKSVKERS